MAELIQTERRFAQIEFDVGQIRSALYTDIADLTHLRRRVDWLLIAALVGSTASLIIGLIALILVLVLL